MNCSASQPATPPMMIAAIQPIAWFSMPPSWVKTATQNLQFVIAENSINESPKAWAAHSQQCDLH
jgi:hypothetical protein